MNRPGPARIPYFVSGAERHIKILAGLLFVAARAAGKATGRGFTRSLGWGKAAKTLGLISTLAVHGGKD